MYKHYGACYVWREKQIKCLKRTESTVAKITEHPARDKSLGILILMLTQPTFRSHQRKERREFKPINKQLILLKKMVQIQKATSRLSSIQNVPIHEVFFRSFYQITIQKCFYSFSWQSKAVPFSIQKSDGRSVGR